MWAEETNIHTEKKIQWTQQPLYLQAWEQSLVFKDFGNITRVGHMNLCRDAVPEGMGHDREDILLSSQEMVLINWKDLEGTHSTGPTGQAETVAHKDLSKNRPNAL